MSEEDIVDKGEIILIKFRIVDSMFRDNKEN